MTFGIIVYLALSAVLSFIVALVNIYRAGEGGHTTIRTESGGAFAVAAVLAVIKGAILILFIIHLWSLQ